MSTKVPTESDIRHARRMRRGAVIEAVAMIVAALGGVVAVTASVIGLGRDGVIDGYEGVWIGFLSGLATIAALLVVPGVAASVAQYRRWSR